MIRPATPEDMDQLAAVHVQSWRESYADVFPAAVLDALDPAERAVRWRNTLLHKPETRIYVAADVTGKIVGFTNTMIPPRDTFADPAIDSEIPSLYVVQSAQGQQYGYGLLQASLADLSARGARCAGLWVLAANDRARRFYERCGWVSVETGVKEVSGVGYDCVAYRFDL